MSIFDLIVLKLKIGLIEFTWALILIIISISALGIVMLFKKITRR